MLRVMATNVAVESVATPQPPSQPSFPSTPASTPTTPATHPYSENSERAFQRMPYELINKMPTQSKADKVECAWLGNAL